MTELRKVFITDEDGQLMEFNSRGHQEVEIASQVSPALILDFSTIVNGEETLTTQAEVDEKIIYVTGVTGVAVGDHIVLTNPTLNIFYVGAILAINTLAITVDAPISNQFPIANTYVNFTSVKMNVDGSTTPVIFSLRTGESAVAPLTNIVADFTRVLLTMITTNPSNLSLFGDQPALTNGCVLREKYGDGTYHNIRTVKSNFDLKKIAYDLDPFFATNPGQGVNGLGWRLTFGGEEKMGTVIRLDSTKDLEWVIQDDLLLIVQFESVGEGALVAD